MMTANLTLPGDFAFGTQSIQVTSNGITTSNQVCFQKIHHYKIEEDKYQCKLIQ